MNTYTPIEITVQTNHIRHNVQVLKKYISSDDNVELAGVVKANAYNIGSIPIVRILEEEKIKLFFVAYLSEALVLRKNFSHISIAVLSGPFTKEELDIYQEYNITPILSTNYQVEEYQRWNAKIPAAIQLETGFSRLGIDPEHVQIDKNLPIVFIMSHLSCARIPNHPNNDKQYLRFQKMVSAFNEAIPKSLIATAGILLPKNFHYQIVRPGIGLYGYGLPPNKRSMLKPAIIVRARVIQIKWLAPNTSIGYDATIVTKERTRIAILSIGYADGLIRRLKNKSFWFEDKQLTILGMISMDLIVVDATHALELREKDWITIIGEQCTPDHLTDNLPATPHEILTYLSTRTKRIFI